MNYETLLVNLDDHVAIVKMNRAQSMNALEHKLGDDLVNCLDLLSENDEVNVVILTGADNAFCAGADLKELKNKMKMDEAKKYVQRLNKIILGIQNMEKPIIAAVNGAAMGAGFSIVMACDLVVASETARFAQPFIHVAAIPDLGGTYFAPRLFGLQKAKELAFTAKILSANEMAELGLINQIVRPEELEHKAIEIAQQIAKRSTMALGLAKKVLNQSWNSSLEQMLETEAQCQAICMVSEDHVKGVRAFFEKGK